MVIVWRVLNACNLSCPFCAFDKHLKLPHVAIDPQQVLRLIAVLADQQKRSGERILLSWLGGEPLLWEPLEQLTLAARAQNIAISATTNGTTLGSSKLRHHLCAAYSELTISIDGFADVHDALRGWNGAFAKLKRWVPALSHEARTSGSPLKLKANIVLMHQNIPQLAELCTTLAEWGITEITFNQLGGRDRPEFYPSHRLTPADADALAQTVPDLQRRLARTGTVLVGAPEYLGRIQASARNEPRAVDDCGPGERFLFIDEKGRISPCSFTGDDYAVGVAEIATADDLSALPARFRAMRSKQCAESCRDCLSTQVCGKFARIAA